MAISESLDYDEEARELQEMQQKDMRSRNVVGRENRVWRLYFIYLTKGIRAIEREDEDKVDRSLMFPSGAQKQIDYYKQGSHLIENLRAERIQVSSPNTLTQGLLPAGVLAAPTVPHAGADEGQALL